MKKQNSSAGHNSALVIGNFGLWNNQLDGQTVKTREFTTALAKYGPYHRVDKFDTSGFRIQRLLRLVAILPVYRDVYLLAGQKALPIIAPLMILTRSRTNLFGLYRNNYYVVIGGWLPTLIARSSYYRLIVRLIDRIFVELPSMQKAIRRVNPNTHTLMNFRDVRPPSSPKDKNGVRSQNLPNRLQAVAFSRLIPEKGVDLAIDTVLQVRERGYDCSLDIYGPFTNDKYAEYIRNRISSIPGVRYQGVLQPGPTIYETLSNYDVMLFPTYYPGEGLPGTIVDAFLSGIPVFATQWRYNGEIIRDGVDGKIFDVDRYVSDCSLALQASIDAPENLVDMKRFAADRGTELTAANGIATLVKIIEKRSFSK
jgi:glycosyltransferase involved in cell wall biosynthesis